jgi:hypothetical protein
MLILLNKVFAERYVTKVTTAFEITKLITKLSAVFPSHQIK